jgi:hypothetical protein
LQSSLWSSSSSSSALQPWVGLGILNNDILCPILCINTCLIVLAYLCLYVCVQNMHAGKETFTHHPDNLPVCLHSIQASSPPPQPISKCRTQIQAFISYMN